MIISHKYGFILLRPRKTGGTSLEAMISPYLGQYDVFSGLKEEIDLPDTVKNHKNGEQYVSGHQSINDVRVVLPLDLLNSYNKISMIRNPWDRLVSMYFFRNEIFEKDYNICNFNHFISSDIWKDGKFKIHTVDEFLSLDNKIYCDMFIRYENYDNDVDSFFKLYNIPIQKNKLRLKSNYRPNSLNYRDLYDNISKDIVEEYFQSDIKMFNYKF